MSKIQQLAQLYLGDYMDDLSDDISDKKLLEKEKELFPDVDHKLYDNWNEMSVLDELSEELRSIKHPQHPLFFSIYQWIVFKPNRDRPDYIWLDKFIRNLVN